MSIGQTFGPNCPLANTYPGLQPGLGKHRAVGPETNKPRNQQSAVAYASFAKRSFGNHCKPSGKSMSATGLKKLWALHLPPFVEMHVPVQSAHQNNFDRLLFIAPPSLYLSVGNMRNRFFSRIRRFPRRHGDVLAQQIKKLEKLEQSTIHTTTRPIARRTLCPLAGIY